MKTVRVAIVDDSTFIRKALEKVLSDISGIKLAGSATSGEELVQRLTQWDPDLVILDLTMPGMGGLKTLEKILKWKKIPVLILSSSRRDAPETLEALNRGAVDFIEKRNYSLVDFAGLRSVLREKILEVCAVYRRRPQRGVERSKGGEVVGVYEAVLIGASTGGPPAIEKILQDFGDDIPVPVAIVQHMPPGFTRALADRLNDNLPLTIKEAEQGEVFAPGAIYIARAGMHMKLKSSGGDVVISLERQPVDAT